MRQVTVTRSELQEIVKRNRDLHHKQFTKAFDNFSKAMRACLEEQLERFKKNPRHSVRITEAPPEDHTGDYDVILKMIEMSVGDTIDIDQASFRQYVLDEWSWKHAWTVSNSKYLPGLPES